VTPIRKTLGDLTDLCSTMPSLSVKLSPKLFDLFQHCELNCNADCCGWDAFDFSERWLSRWCDFRDADTINKARRDIERIRGIIADRDPQTQIEIEPYHQPTIATLVVHLDAIDGVLAGHDGS